jgi:hypothetical protein
VYRYSTHTGALTFENAHSRYAKRVAEREERKRMKKQLKAKYMERGIAKIPKREVIAVKRRDFTPFTNPLPRKQMEYFERHPEKRREWERRTLGKVFYAPETLGEQERTTAAQVWDKKDKKGNTGNQGNEKGRRARGSLAPDDAALEAELRAVATNKHLSRLAKAVLSGDDPDAEVVAKGQSKRRKRARGNGKEEGVRRRGGRMSRSRGS